ncbi:hypothetical protein ACP70R_014796 [Stipagrostis hirtigluma subsp. patula]
MPISFYGGIPDFRYRLTDEVGACFLLGAAAGSAIYFVRGFRGSPTGGRLVGGVHAARTPPTPPYSAHSRAPCPSRAGGRTPGTPSPPEPPPQAYPVCAGGFPPSRAPRSSGARSSRLARASVGPLNCGTASSRPATMPGGVAACQRL